MRRVRIGKPVAMIASAFSCVGALFLQKIAISNPAFAVAIVSGVIIGTVVIVVSFLLESGFWNQIKTIRDVTLNLLVGGVVLIAFVCIFCWLSLDLIKLHLLQTDGVTTRAVIESGQYYESGRYKRYVFTYMYDNNGDGIPAYLGKATSPLRDGARYPIGASIKICYLPYLPRVSYVAGELASDYVSQRFDVLFISLLGILSIPAAKWLAQRDKARSISENQSEVEAIS